MRCASAERCSAAFIVFLSSVYYFGFGDDPKLVKDSTLAVMLLAGLFGYRSAPSPLEIVAYLAYLIPVLTLFLWLKKWKIEIAPDQHR